MKPRDKKNYKSILLILSGIGIVIILYGAIMKIFFKGKMAHKDFMNHKIIDVNIFESNCCSVWPLSHFVLYLILAFLFPDCLLFLFVLGVAWELMEMSGDVLISRYGKGQKRAEYNKKVEYSGAWVRGSFKDVVFNSAGLAVGYGLRRAYDALRRKEKYCRECKNARGGCGACKK